MTDVRWTQLSADAARVQLKAATKAVELKASTASVLLTAQTAAVTLMATTSAVTIATAVYGQFIIISEAITGQFVDFRRLYDNAQTSDVMVRVMNYLRLFNDSVDTSDNTVLHYSKNAIDTATVSDTATRRTGLNKLEQISTADAKAFVASKPLADSVSMDDYLTKVMHFARFFTDYVTTDDTLVVKEPGKNILSGNTAVIEDVIQLTVEYIRNYADSSTISDAVSLEPQKPFQDALTALDTFQRQVDFKRSFIDTPTTSDIIQLFATFARSLSDNVSTSDSITRIANYIRSFSDMVGLTDSQTLTPGKGVFDTAPTSDTFSRQAEFHRAFEDEPTARDTFYAIVDYDRGYYDSVTAADTFAKTIVKNFTDTVYMTDVIPFSGANFVDTSAVNDVGYYRGQNYSDFSYFAEDFVGYSGTF